MLLFRVSVKEVRMHKMMLVMRMKRKLLTTVLMLLDILAIFL